MAIIICSSGCVFFGGETGRNESLIIKLNLTLTDEINHNRKQAGS